MKACNEQSTLGSRKIGRLTRLSAVAAVSLIGSGCYTYTPMSHDLAPVGEEVRVVVTRTGAGRLADEMQLDAAAPVLIGNVTGREPGFLLLRVPGPSNRPIGVAGVEIAQIARVPVDQVLSLETREMSTGRTVGLVGALVAGTTFAVLGIMEASGSDSGGGGGDIVLAISGLRFPFR